MAMKQTRRESEMLSRVRAWRKAAYEADQKLSPQDREKRRDDLLREFGLTARPPSAKPTK